MLSMFISSMKACIKLTMLVYPNLLASVSENRDTVTPEDNYIYMFMYIDIVYEICMYVNI